MSAIFTALDVLVVLFSLLAAVFWLLSARVQVPSYPNPEASPNVKNAQSHRVIEQLRQAMTRQSKFSALGAFAAAGAALASGISVALKSFSVIG